MRISSALPTGVTAVLFEQARRRRHLESELSELLEAAGFSEVILPMLDYFEPYEPLLSPNTRDELYRFVDRDGQLLAVRADFTPMLARLLAPRLDSLALPLRLFYRGDVVRHQEARAGRLREYYQIGAEIVGPSRGESNEEALRLFLDLALASGVESLRVVMGFAGALDHLLLSAPEGIRGAELAVSVMRRDRGATRRASTTLLEVVENGVPQDPDGLGAEAAASLVELLALRDRLQAVLGVRGGTVDVDLAEFATNTLDPSLAVADSRWTYYDGVVFRAYVADSALELGGGGRYDSLYRTLGADVSAIGFSLGLDGLLRAGEGPG